MKSIVEIKNQIRQQPEYWQIPFMDFVDDFRRYKDISAIEIPYQLDDEKIDALLAATIEYLCHEQGLEVPNWVFSIPACQHPWFVAGIENLKAIALVESPLEFRIRKMYLSCAWVNAMNLRIYSFIFNNIYFRQIFFTKKLLPEM